MEPLPPDFWALNAVVAGAAVTHTLIGADHYIPFVVLRRARGWSRARTLWLTAVCGIGHCLASVVLALGAIWLAREATSFGRLQEQRGTLAAVILILFGALLALRGLWGPKHRHAGDEGKAALARSPLGITLLLAFVLGPCEILIPASMWAAARFGLPGCLAVAGVFTTLTVLTMLVMVLALSEGWSRLHLRFLERHATTLAGLAICAVGGLTLLGL